MVHDHDPQIYGRGGESYMKASLTCLSNIVKRCQNRTERQVGNGKRVGERER